MVYGALCAPYPALFYLGERSYGLYLVHRFTAGLYQEIYNLVGMNGGWYSANSKSNIVGILFIILITLALSEILHRFIEIPCMRYGKKLSQVQAAPLVSSNA